MNQYLYSAGCDAAALCCGYRLQAAAPMHVSFLSHHSQLHVDSPAVHICRWTTDGQYLVRAKRVNLYEAVRQVPCCWSMPPWPQSCGHRQTVMRANRGSIQKQISLGFCSPNPCPLLQHLGVLCVCRPGAGLLPLQRPLPTGQRSAAAAGPDSTL